MTVSSAATSSHFLCHALVSPGIWITVQLFSLWVLAHLIRLSEFIIGLHVKASEGADI